MDDSSNESVRRDRDELGDEDQPPRQRLRVDPLLQGLNIEIDNQDNEDVENEISDLPRPILDSTSNRRTIERTEVISLSTLSKHGAEPRMDKAIVLQLIRLIPHNPYSQNGNAQTYSRPRGYGPVRPSSMPYTRLFMCRVFSEREGNLLVYNGRHKQEC